MFFFFASFFNAFLSQNKAHPSKNIRVLGLLVASDHMKVIDTVCYCMRIRIRDLMPFNSWIRDPGWVKKSGSGSGMNNPDHISESFETIFWG
jgi:hypothetical protein